MRIIPRIKISDSSIPFMRILQKINQSSLELALLPSYCDAMESNFLIKNEMHFVKNSGLKIEM